MNFSRTSGKARPIVKHRIIQIPIGSSSHTIITQSPSKPRSNTKEPGQTTPGSITKATRPPPILTNNTLGIRLLDLYLEGRLIMHSYEAVRAREQGVSPKDIEPFDLTSLYGAREDAVEQLHANNALVASQDHSSPPRQVSGSPVYSSGSDTGEMFGWMADREILPPDPQVRIAPAPPSLVVSFPLPQGSKLALSAPISTTPPRKTANRPPAPSGPPTNAAYAVGSRQIPQAVQVVVDEIRARAARKSNKSGFPQRVDLRNMPSGMTDLDRRYGYITRGSGLMGFYGDLRLFNEVTWKYLVSSGKGD